MSTPANKNQVTEYQRFNVHQQLQHVLIIISFVGLGLSGLPIRWHASSYAQFMVKIFGNMDNILTFHLVNGGIMLATSAYHLIYLFLYAIKHRTFGYTKAWLTYPQMADVKTVPQYIKFILGLTDERPKFERYSFKEKFDYIAVFWGMFIIGGSGVFMWFPDLGASLFPRWIIDMWRLGHSDEAILAVTFIAVVHFYNVHFSPDFFPYNSSWWTGKMSREVMLHEHPAELERIEGITINEQHQTEGGHKPWNSKNM